MEYAEALRIIRDKAGFRVGFERREGGMLVSDHFPNRDEETIPTEEEAWKLAQDFARAGKGNDIVNVYVIHGDNWKPVCGYEKRKLNID